MKKIFTNAVVLILSIGFIRQTKTAKSTILQIIYETVSITVPYEIDFEIFHRDSFRKKKVSIKILEQQMF